MELRKINIEKKRYDVVTTQEYCEHPDIYDPRHTALMDVVEGYALPILTPTDNQSVGIRLGGIINIYNPPQTEEEKIEYSLDKMVDMSNPKSYKDVIEASQKLRDTERDILLTVDNVTKPYIGPHDTPAMALLKEAVSLKNCDLKSYAHRFGSNFPNEQRIMNDEDVSLKKIIKYGNSLDMKVTLTIEDQNEDVPNPMSKKISAELTNGGNGGIIDE